MQNTPKYKGKIYILEQNRVEHLSVISLNRDFSTMNYKKN